MKSPRADPPGAIVPPRQLVTFGGVNGAAFGETMIFVVFVFGVLAGIATAALIWLGLSSALVVAGFGVLLLLCAVLSSAVAGVLASSPDDQGGSDPVKTAPGP